MLMSLQLIYGPSGSGKSYTLYKKIIEQSIREPDREFIVIVPEQFTHADTAGTRRTASKQGNFKY